MQAVFRKPAYLLAPLLGALYAFAAIHYFSSYSYLITLGLIALCMGILLAFTDYAPLFKLLYFIIPLSLETALGSGDTKMLIPSEPVMMLLAIAFGVVVLFRRGIPRAFLSHPVSISIFVYLGILALTCFASSMPVVSVKYAIVSFAYVFVFYLLAQDFLRRKEGNIPLVFFIYGAGVFYVVCRALYLHSTTGFYHELAGLVVHPFFIDHTIYSACLAMLLPAFIVFGLKRRVFGLSQTGGFLCAFVAFILAAAVFFSFSRAAWMSAGAALLFYFVLKLRISPRHLGIGMLAIVLLAWIYNDAIIQGLKYNRYSSTTKSADLTEQTLSVGNISSDASNAERLNRWSCALRMFRDKPLTGFGPGTYQFEYLAYQRPEEMTRLSVTSAYNNVYGRGGSAHSEYLLALSEMGIGGLIAFSLIVISVIACGMRAYYRAADERSRLIALLALTGFITYAVHGFFNNFLNNNKPASLFWLLAAVVVLTDLRTNRNVRREADV